MNRRGFLQGVFAAGMAPAIVRVSSLMPVRSHVAYLTDPDNWYLSEKTIEDSVIELAKYGCTVRVLPTQIIAVPSNFAEILRPALQKVWVEQDAGLTIT